MNDANFSFYPLDIQANTISVDSEGRFALLGCRRELVLVNLKDLSQKDGACYKRYSIQSKYDPSAIQWHPSDATFFITALDVRGVIWQFNDRQLKKYATLRGFTRGISALDWNPTDTNLIATTSLGNLQAVSIWDFRDTKKHVISSESIAGASQVRWNRIRSHVFATAHESTVRLWDMRNSRIEWSSIPAHVAKISDLDWSPYDEHELVTAGQECKLKVWNVRSKERCLTEAPSNGIPFSRARYAPFGRALVTQPSTLKRADTGVVLWSLSGNSSATESITVVRCFETHPGDSYAIAFDWRRGNAYRPPQIISWSSEHTLNLWSISEEVQEQCGVLPESDSSPIMRGPIGSTSDTPAVVSFVIGSLDSNGTAATVTPPPATTNSVLSDTSMGPRDMRDATHGHMVSSPEHSRLSAVNGETDGPHHPTPHILRRTPSAGGARSLFHELQQLMHALVGENKIVTEELDASVKRCRFTISVKRLKLRLQIAFPSGYPNGVMPSFVFLPPRPNWEQNLWDHLLNTLHDTAYGLVSQSRGCVEVCLRQIVHQLEVMQMPDEPPMYNDGMGQNFFPTFGLHSMQDSRGYAPMPRMMVARFSRCGNYLVCFRRAPIPGESLSTPWAVLDLQGPQVHYTVAASPPSSSQLDYNSDSGRSATPRRNRHHRPNANRRALSQVNTAQHPTRHKTTSLSGSAALQNLSFNPMSGTMTSFVPHDSRNNTQIPVQTTEISSTNTDTASDSNSKSGRGPQVLLYDVTRLNLVSRRMAEDYQIPSDTSEETSLADVCQHNANVAANHGRMDLVQLWKTCRTMCTAPLRPSPTPSDLPPWASLPFGRKLIESWVKHYSGLRDVQTLGMLSHLLKNLEALWKIDPHLANNGNLGCGTSQTRDRSQFGNANWRRRTTIDEESRSSSFMSAVYVSISPRGHDVQMIDTRFMQPMTQNSISKMIPFNRLKEQSSRPRSCSWSEQCDDTTIFDKGEDKIDPVMEKHLENCRLLSSTMVQQMDAFLSFYGELLYVWDLLTPRTRLLKVLENDPSIVSWNFLTACRTCTRDVTVGKKCPTCEQPQEENQKRTDEFMAHVLCALCREPVYGLTAMCELCGHFGHWSHMLEWFRKTDVCPQGCGCHCKMF